ncbi:MAG: YraN family protein [Clostridiales bacterium]|nr:YraN family protein [Clostridiales bacterium]
MAENKRRVGAEYEDRAARFLTEKGLRILRRNYRCPQGEIDIIAREGACLVFVEVKARRGTAGGSPFSAVGPAKQKVISRVAEDYLARVYRRTDIPCRFDVIGFEGKEVYWLRDAFDYRH